MYFFLLLKNRDDTYDLNVYIYIQTRTIVCMDIYTTINNNDDDSPHTFKNKFQFQSRERYKKNTNKTMDEKTKSSKLVNQKP